MNENITFAQLNIRSLVPKFVDLKEHMVSQEYDILCLTETWLTPAIGNEIVSVEGYDLVREDRRVGRGGGVCIYIKKSLSYSIINTDYQTEQLWVKTKINGQEIAVGVLYRPPDFAVNTFVDLLELTVTNLLLSNDEIFCLGDFNIDMLKPDSVASQRLSMIFETYGLSQIVNSPTRITLSTATLIDLILTTSESIVQSVHVIPLDHMSDHELVSCTLKITGRKVKPAYKTVRDFKNFNYEIFLQDLRLIPLEIIYDINNVNEKLKFLNESLISLFNIHAPYKTFRITKKYSPWITDNIRLLMSLRDKARMKWRRTKSETHHNYYKALRNYTTLACKNEKKAYFQQKLRLNGTNKIWKDLSLLNLRKQNKAIPDHLKDVDAINNYYKSCIPSLPINSNLINHYKDNIKAGVEPFKFSTVSEDDIKIILYNIKTNATGYDGLNIKMLLFSCPLILPYITHIINTCLTENIFPDCWKQALVIPMPKCSDPKEFKDLRPISILPAMSKVLERVVDMQIRLHITTYNILPEVQSGFRPLHSCETALLNITDDIIRGTDQNQVTVLVLVDFSKAFDTINYEILFAILKYIGLRDSTICFFQNYLNTRLQRVKIDNDVSAPLEMLSGVPQGSILGPLLFSLYTSEFEKKIQHSQIHFYADDTQIYRSFQPNDYAIAIDELNEDLDRLITVSRDHALHINPNKTSVLVFGPQMAKARITEHVKINFDGQQLSPTTTAKNLGLYFDTTLRFKVHINHCIRTAYANLKMIYNNRRFLSKKVKIILCESLVLSRFNFGDTVYGPCIDATDSRRIQVVQNACLRLIFGIRRRQNISHKLAEAAWLNMSNRRLLHSACLFHKIIINRTPNYLYRKITFRTDVHNVNIRFKGRLTPPIHHSELFKRSFSYQVVNIYNSILPGIKEKSINVFKSKIKANILDKQNRLLVIR